MTRTAPLHYALMVNVSDFSYWSIFNVLHVPATQVLRCEETNYCKNENNIFSIFFFQVPLGVDSNGLPLGIQVVAARNRDRDCLAVAEELEKAFGGWKSPF